MAIGVILGSQWNRPKMAAAPQAMRVPTNLAPTQKAALAKAINLILKRIGDKSDEKSEWSNPQVAMQHLNEKVSEANTGGEYHIDAFHRDAGIQAQVAQARQQVEKELAKRYGKAVKREQMEVALNHADVLQERTENPMQNPFATTQQKMESLQTKDEGAIANVGDPAK